MSGNKTYTDRIKALISRPPGAGPEAPITPPFPPPGAQHPTDATGASTAKPPSGPIIFPATKIKKDKARRGGIPRRRRAIAADDWRIVALTVASVALAALTLVLVWVLAVIRPKMQAHIAQQQSQIELQAHEAAKLRASLAEKEQELIRAHSNVGVLSVETTPAGAMITFAGRSGVSPTNFSAIALGNYTLTAQLEGYSDVNQTIALTNDVPVKLSLELHPSYGQLSIASEPPGATFSLESRGRVIQSGQTPARLEKLHAGKYQIEVKKGAASYREMLEITKDHTTEFQYKFRLGRLRIESDPPGADVLINAQKIGKTPLLLTEVLEGPVEFELRQHKFLSKRLGAQIVADQEAVAVAKLEPNLGPPPGKDFTSASGLEMVWLNAGFWVSRHEVTQMQFFTIMGSDPSGNKGKLRPVDSVTWSQAVAFCDKVTKAEDNAESLPAGYAYSLPTEKEWLDFAGPPHSSGVTVLGSAIGTVDVSRTPPNGLGLKGIWGNVWEWCLDSDGHGRILRGGGWTPIYDGLKQITDRTSAQENETNASFGFRVILKPVHRK